MKVKEDVTVFQCDHCGKKLFRRHAMIKHETRCTHNPENIAKCSGCDFLEEVRKRYMVESDEGFGMMETSSKAFRCTKLDKMLYPAKVVHKGLLEKHPETFKDQEQMPKECEHFSFNPGF